MALLAEISSSYAYGEMAHPARINQTSFRSSGSTVPQEGRNDPVVVTFHQDLHASHGSMVAELAQALCRQPNRGGVGQADSDRPAEHMYERAVQVRREVDVLLCVLSAGSQLRIRDHRLCRCAQEVDGKTGSFRLLAGFGSPSGLELGEWKRAVCRRLLAFCQSRPG